MARELSESALTVLRDAVVVARERQVQKVRTLRLALRERGHADTDIEEALRYWSEHLQKRRAA
jgi:hypothetical protein